MMVGSRRPGSDAGDVPPRHQLIGSGPFLVLSGPGAQCDSLVELVQRQCTAHGVITTIDAIDNAARHVLNEFPGLVLVLPTSADDAGVAQLQHVAQLIKDYRSRKRHGLRWLLTNDEAVFSRAGVIQVVALRAVMDHPRLARALSAVCALHYTDPHEAAVDVMRPYLGRGLTAVRDLDEEPNVETETITALACYVGSWGVSELGDVRRLRERIEWWRSHLDSPRYPELRRPIDGREMNRLDLILDEPDVVPPDLDKMSPTLRRNKLKTWNENGAGVWRRVRDDMLTIVPGLARPGGRANTKHAQMDLHRLYAALVALDDYLQVADEDEWPTLA